MEGARLIVDTGGDRVKIRLIIEGVLLFEDDAERKARLFADLNDDAELRERLFADLNEAAEPRERLFADLNEAVEPRERLFADLNEAAELRERLFADLNEAVDAGGDRLNIEGIRGSAECQDRPLLAVTNEFIDRVLLLLFVDRFMYHHRRILFFGQLGVACFVLDA